MDHHSTDLALLLRKADTLVEGAFSAEYRQDPVLSTLSRVHGIAQCVTREHGILLEEAIALGLRRSGRIEVSRGVRFPITDAARSLVASNRGEALDRIRLTFDAEARSTFDLDLAAVSVDGARAWAVDIKRGGGSTSGTRRAQTERELRAVKLLLRSFFRQQGYPVDDVSVAVIDVYGAGRFGSGLTVTRTGIDQLFGVPVLDVIDALENRLRLRLDAAWTELAASLVVSRDVPVADHRAQDGIAIAHDTPVASTRSAWGLQFGINARRAASRTRSVRNVAFATIEREQRSQRGLDSC